MIGKLFQTALLVVPLLLAGCSKPPAEAPAKTTHIKGQIFIVQKNRMNLKLGGVEVRYVPREELQKRCRWIAENRAKASVIARYEEELGRIDSTILETSSAKHAGKIRDFLSSARQRQADAWKSFRESPALEDYQMLLRVREDYRESFEEAGFQMEKEQWAMSALFFDWLVDHASALTETDADGNYSITVSGPVDGYLFAQTSRDVSEDNREQYYWISEVTPSTTGPVHLSTLGLLSTTNLEDLIPATEATEQYSSESLTKELGLQDLSWFSEAKTLLHRIAANQADADKLRSQAEKVKAEIESVKYMNVEALEKAEAP